MTQTKTNGSAAATRTAEAAQKSDSEVLSEVLSLVEATARELGISSSELQLTKDVYAKGATDQELALFLRTADRLGLEVTARQIFLVKRWDSSLEREVATPQVSIDGQRLIAERTKKYVPGRESTYGFKADRLEYATAYVKKFVQGEWHEITATAFYDEYVQANKKTGNPNTMWTKYPRVMLAKCAESLALRKAFPAELGGVYTDVEMGTDPQQIIGTETDSAIRPPTKGQLVETYRGAPSSAGPEIDDAVTNEKPLITPADAKAERAKALNEMSPEEYAWRVEIQNLMADMEMSAAAHENVINNFDNSPHKREIGLNEVRKKAISHVIGSDKWDYSEDATNRLLEEKFGITVLAEADPSAIEACVNAFRKDGFLK